MNKSEELIISLMCETLEKIDTYIAGMSHDDFLRDGKTQSAVIMQLEVLGELAKRVSDPTRSSIAIPWKDMSGLRDLVAHQYFGLDIEMIWQTASVHAPKVRQELNAYRAVRL